MARSPFEIIAGPAEVFVAPLTEAFPATDLIPPGGNWVSLGQTEGGVNVTHTSTIEELRTDQATGPIKFLRTEEGLEIAFSIAEMTLENYAAILNDLTVTDTAEIMSVAGFRSIDLHFGVDVSCVAMLIRGPSPYMDSFLQYEIPVVAQVGSPTVSFVRDDKSVLECEWMAAEDENAATDNLKFGQLIAQDAAAL